MNIEEQIEKKFIVGSHGKYAVDINEKSPHNCWLFERHADGKNWFSLRMALPSEVIAAQRQLEFLNCVADIPVRG